MKPVIVRSGSLFARPGVLIISFYSIRTWAVVHRKIENRVHETDTNILKEKSVLLLEKLKKRQRYSEHKWKINMYMIAKNRSIVFHGLYDGWICHIFHHAFPPKVFKIGQSNFAFSLHFSSTKDISKTSPSRRYIHLLIPFINCSISNLSFWSYKRARNPCTKVQSYEYVFSYIK